MALSYLTVQDMLFLNLQITKSPQPFDYAKLEEAVFYQYASGQSTDLVQQGARFLVGFAKMAPFSRGNTACAFVGMVAFLEANGRTLDLSDDEAVSWIDVDDRGIASTAISSKIREGELMVAYGVPDYQEICLSVIERYPKTIAAALAAEASLTA
jgi:death-on-curing protein